MSCGVNGGVDWSADIEYLSWRSMVEYSTCLLTLVPTTIESG